MKLDLSSLTKALASFDSALQVSTPGKMETLDDALQDVIRAGVIQNFEFTYEICASFIHRWLVENIGESRVKGTTRRELYRLAMENALIADVDDWMEYYEARNRTSHTYDSDTAEEIFKIAQNFVHDVRRLLQVLEQKND